MVSIVNVLNVKVLVGAFNQEKALVGGLLRDYELSDGPSFQALSYTLFLSQEDLEQQWSFINQAHETSFDILILPFVFVCDIFKRTQKQDRTLKPGQATIIKISLI